MKSGADIIARTLRRGVIIYNPRSGVREVYRELMDVSGWFQRRGWSIDLETTHARGDAGRLARTAAESGVDAVFVAGGDGTLNEAVNALVGTRTAVGLLPCGTANVWARQMRLPLSSRSLPEVARLMDEAVVRSIDVGCATLNPESDRAETRHFLLWSGLGLDAHITRSIEPRPASFKRWGQMGYALAALRLTLAYRGVRAEIEIDGQVLRERVLLMVVSNAQLYAGYFHLASGAKLDDGYLDVSLFPGRGFFDAVRYIVQVLLRRHTHGSRVAAYRARTVRVRAGKRCDVHVDAEPIGTTPVAYSIEPGALRVMVPLSAPGELFTTEPEAMPWHS